MTRKWWLRFSTRNATADLCCYLLHIFPTVSLKMASPLDLSVRRRSPSVNVPIRRQLSSITSKHPHPLLVSSTSWSIIKSDSLQIGSSSSFFITSLTCTYTQSQPNYISLTNYFHWKPNWSTTTIFEIYNYIVITNSQYKKF